MKQTLKTLIAGAALTVAAASATHVSAEPFLGEIAWVPYNFAPRGWQFCDGQLLPINQYSALFSLLGTTYGGDGRTTFGIPDLKGRTAIHEGQGPGLTNRPLGQKLGQETVTLSAAEMPSHTHTQMASSGAPSSADPSGKVPASPSRTRVFADAPNVAMNTGNIGNSGGGQPHNNMQPYTTLNCIIATVGIFPSRN